MYNTENIFAKIIRGELPCSMLYEDEHLIAIKDASPAAPIHILVIPKGNFTDFVDFTENASPEKICHYFRKVSEIAKENNAVEYRIVSNVGAASGQTVFHFHTHIISGGNFSRLV